MLLYLTQQPIVAAPYHRTLDGLLEAARFFCERDPVAARKRLDRLGVGYIVVPYRAHEQLMNMEQIVFGELRSFDLPATTQDAQGLPVQRLRYRPEAAQAMAYRLTMEGGRGIPGLRAIAWSREGAATPDGLSGLVYAVEPLTSTDKSQDRP